VPIDAEARLPIEAAMTEPTTSSPRSARCGATLESSREKLNAIVRVISHREDLARRDSQN